MYGRLRMPCRGVFLFETTLIAVSLFTDSSLLHPDVTGFSSASSWRFELRAALSRTKCAEHERVKAGVTAPDSPTC